MRTRHTFCISFNTQRNGTEVGEKCCAHQKSNAEVNKCSALAGTECETDEKWRIERDVDGSQECGKIVRNICLVFNVFRLCAAIYSSKYNPRKEITMAITWELLRTVVFPSVLFRAFNFFVVPFCSGCSTRLKFQITLCIAPYPDTVRIQTHTITHYLGCCSAYMIITPARR